MRVEDIQPRPSWFERWIIDMRSEMPLQGPPKETVLGNVQEYSGKAPGAKNMEEETTGNLGEDVRNICLLYDAIKAIPEARRNAIVSFVQDRFEHEAKQAFRRQREEKAGQVDSARD